MHRRLAELVTEPELRARHLALSDPAGEGANTGSPWMRLQRSPAPEEHPPQPPNLLELAIGLQVVHDP